MVSLIDRAVGSNERQSCSRTNFLLASVSGSMSKMERPPAQQMTHLALTIHAGLAECQGVRSEHPQQDRVQGKLFHYVIARK